MEEKTKAAYRKLAEYHYKKINGKPFASNVRVYLLAISIYLSPAYFRRLRNAIAFDQKEKGYDKNAKEINSIKNPVTNKKNKGKIKSSFIKKRVKNINDADMKKINNALNQKDDSVLSAVINVLKFLGTRPAELMDIKLLTNNNIYIKGAKKTENGNRGADRVIKVHPKLYSKLRSWLSIIHSKAKKDEKFSIDNYRCRFYYLVKKLFPSRKRRPNLYTFRHMMGSKLKVSKFNKYQISYIMGHQSTGSISVYGNKNFAKSSSSSAVFIQPAISTDRIKKIVRDNKTNYKKIGKVRASSKKSKYNSNSVDI